MQSRPGQHTDGFVQLLLRGDGGVGAGRGGGVRDGRVAQLLSGPGISFWVSSEVGFFLFVGTFTTTVCESRSCQCK